MLVIEVITSINQSISEMILRYYRKRQTNQILDPDPGNINITFRANYKESSHVDSLLKLPVTEEMQETWMHLKIRMDHLTTDEQNEMTTLIFNSRDLFSKNDHDIGCFTATDNGPSKVRSM